MTRSASAFVARIVFGAGARNCVAPSLARHVLRTALAEVASRFQEWRLADAEFEPTSRLTGELQPLSIPMRFLDAGSAS